MQYVVSSLVQFFFTFNLILNSAEFCKNCLNEFCEDSRQYIGDLLMWKKRLTQKK